MTLGFQNHWRITNGGVGIVPRDLTLAEIRSNPLFGRMRGWHYNRGAIQQGSTVFIKNGYLPFFFLRSLFVGAHPGGGSGGEE